MNYTNFLNSFKNENSFQLGEFKQIMKKKCLECPKEFEELEELLHHLHLEHQGISSEMLKQATAAHQTKQQLGDYVGPNDRGVGFECPHCYEMFSGLQRLSDHAREIHKVQFAPDFLEKLQNMPKLDKDNPPICEKCHQKFLGLVTTKINSKVVHVCFTCYENHYGANALLRLTIGTPDDMIEKMKKPL